MRFFFRRHPFQPCFDFERWSPFEVKISNGALYIVTTHVTRRFCVELAVMRAGLSALARRARAPHASNAIRTTNRRSVVANGAKKREKSTANEVIPGGAKFHLLVSRDDCVDDTSPRLDAYVASSVVDASASRARVARAIKASMVKVNGKTERKPARGVKPGDIVEGELEGERRSEAIPEPSIELDIVYEDESVLVVCKPAGMVTHPSAGHARGTLVNAVLGHCDLPELVVPTGRVSNRMNEDGDFDDDDGPSTSESDSDAESASDSDDDAGSIRPGIVHRLDRGTSGVMVVAKDASAHNSLCNQFASRTVRRRYVAILSGVPKTSKGRIEAPVGRDPKDRLRMAVTPGSGRYAASNYEVIATLASGNASLVEWRLETGRTHQIRVHAKHIGHPILGDEVYGGGGGAAVDALARRGVFDLKAAKALLSRIDRPMLHARTLGFTHPRTGEAMDFSRDPPEDFDAFASALAER